MLKKGLERESVFHILKGGEDSVGDLLAVQRVYINIGSCSEQCWLNHLTDLYQLDPQQRNSGRRRSTSDSAGVTVPTSVRSRTARTMSSASLLSKKAYSSPIWKAKGTC